MKNTAFLLATLSISTVVLAQGKPSFVGNWKMDIAQSDLGSEPAPKSVTGTILKDTPQMMSWSELVVDDKGKRVAYSWSGPEDGSMHPLMMDGKPNGGHQSMKKEQDGTNVLHGEEPDGSSFESRYSLSPDGNTFTAETTAKSKDGKESREKAVWHRVGAQAKPAS
jgi:hypothetical protein